MSRYNKVRLQNMLEQQRAARLTLRDLSERTSDARSEKARAQNKIHEETDGYRLPDGLLARLLALPTDEAFALAKDEIEAFALAKDEIEEYVAERNGGKVRCRAGISIDAYRRYIHARDKVERLSEALESAKTAFDERFGIVPNLVDAVRSWGFANPEMEI